MLIDIANVYWSVTIFELKSWIVSLSNEFLDYNILFISLALLPSSRLNSRHDIGNLLVHQQKEKVCVLIFWFYFWNQIPSFSQSEVQLATPAALYPLKL